MFPVEGNISTYFVAAHFIRVSRILNYLYTIDL